jgi:hypothetical protein
LRVQRGAKNSSAETAKHRASVRIQTIMVMRWAGHVAHMGRTDVLTKVWQKETDCWEDICVAGKIILTRTSGKN